MDDWEKKAIDFEKNTIEPKREAIRSIYAGTAQIAFFNRMAIEELRRLEPHHPLLGVPFRAKIGRWGAFAAQETEGTTKMKTDAAHDAGRTFVVPKFLRKDGVER